MRSRAVAIAVVAVATLAIANPANASTRLIDVQYSGACAGATRDFYTTVSADAQEDGQSKIDLANLKFGAKLNGLLCGGVSEVCVEGRVTTDSTGTGWAGSTPFGGLPLAFPGYYPTGVGTSKTPYFDGWKCWYTTSPTFGASVTLAPEQGYVFTGGYYQLKNVTIQARAAVVINGAWHYSPYATQKFVNPLVNQNA